MTANLFAQLRSFLTPLSPIPEAELTQFAQRMAVTIYRSGDAFTKMGDHHDRVGFVLKGLFRVFYTDVEGHFHNRNFCTIGVPVGSYATILTGQPAHVTIEAMEASEVAHFSYKELAALYDTHPAWERLGRKLAESHYIARERREFYLLTLDATGRYQKFLEDFPGLDQRISQVNIASYIGVAPETLSRILKKLNHT